MKKIYLLIFCFFTVTAFGQSLWDSTYAGNGKTGFGGTVGEGTLQILFRADSVIFTFTRGPGDLNDIVILYLQAGNPDLGFSSTANFTDFGDPLRAAISGYDGTHRSILNFAPGFKPSQALAFYSEFAGSFEMRENGSHKYDTTMNLQPLGDKKSPTYRFALKYSGGSGEGGRNTTLKSSGDEPFYFLVTYISASGYRSNEFMGDVGPSGNIGWDIYNSTTFNTGTAPATVPVTLVNFTASNNNNKVNLQWVTAQESNIDKYEILRSADGNNFAKIGFVNATNNLLEQVYSYEDLSPLSGNSFYKLGIVSKDGHVEFSKIVSIKSAVVNSFKAYTTSSNKVLKIELEDAGTGNLLVEMSNSVGQKIFQSQINSNGTNQYSVDLNKTLATGIYAVTISKDGVKYSKMIMVK